MYSVRRCFRSANRRMYHCVQLLTLRHWCLLLQRLRQTIPKPTLLRRCNLFIQSVLKIVLVDHPDLLNISNIYQMVTNVARLDLPPKIDRPMRLWHHRGLVRCGICENELKMNDANNNASKWRLVCNLHNHVSVFISFAFLQLEAFTVLGNTYHIECQSV